MPRNYVDNAYNRSLGRVGMPVGSAVHSRSTSASSMGLSAAPSRSIGFSAAPSRTYVDNAMNQRLGRVGLPLGSAVQSKSNSSSFSGSSSSSTKTYVDNPLNRSLDRVGLPMGSAVHSKNASASTSTSSSPGSSTKTYVDNPLNRSLDRVGLPMGSAVHSKNASASTSSSSSLGSSTKTYVDNPLNRSLDRVGLPMGSAVYSKNASASTSSSSPGTSSSTKLYVDNPMNRKLERVGLPLGTAVHSKKGSVSSSTSASPRFDGKVYKDNDFNRRHNRVGLPLGSKPIKNGKHVYEDNAINRHLERVGKPMGTQAVSKSQLAKLRKWLQSQSSKGQNVMEDSGFAESAGLPCLDNFTESNDQSFDNYQHVMEGFNREREEDLWMDLTGKSIRSSIQATESSCRLTSIQSKPIKLHDITLMSEIGHGAFGKVYMAEYEGQVIAVKFLTEANFTNKRIKMFENEITTHSKLNHPNIVKFFGPCLEMPKLAIVMEYMDASLWESLHVNEVEFPLREKLNIIHDATSGLDYLHGIPLVHADLKTQNILLINIPGTPSFDDCLPTKAKLSDFGLSLLKSDTETSQSKFTTQKQLVGATYRYAAPEVIRGDMLDTNQMLKTDIYSMGLIIMELAVERISFENLNFFQLMKQVGENGTKPTPPPGLMLDKDLEKLLHQCWSFEPSKRPDAGKLKMMASKLSAILEE